MGAVCFGVLKRHAAGWAPRPGDTQPQGLPPALVTHPAVLPA
jgi:hypothetical protein